jgi:hypothetical protein
MTREKRGLLAVLRTVPYLFNIMRYAHTAQVQPWADSQANPYGGECDT